MNQDPRAAFAGQITDVPVVELLQTILQGGHSGVARFETPVGAATLWFREGALIDADMGRHHMEAAVQRLLALETGTFEVEFKPITRRSVIKTSTADMIAQAPGRAGVPTAMGPDDTDVGRKRARRQGVSWHPTGGGRGKQDSSTSVPIVLPPGMRPLGGSATAAPPTPDPPQLPVSSPASTAATPDRTMIAPPPHVGDPRATLLAPAVSATPTSASPEHGRVSGVAPTVAMPAVLSPHSPSPTVVASPSVIAGPSTIAASPRAAVPPIVIAPPPSAAVVAAQPQPQRTFEPPGGSSRRTMFGVPVVAPPRPEPASEPSLAASVPSPPARVLPDAVDEPDEADRTLMRVGPVPPARPVQSPATQRNPAMMFVPAPPPMPGEQPAPGLRFEQQPAQWTHVGGTLPAIAAVSPLPIPTAMGAMPTAAELPPALGVPAPVLPTPSAPIPSAMPIESGRTAFTHGEIRRPARAALPPAPGWPSAPPMAAPHDPGVDKIVVSPEAIASQTMTAGSGGRDVATAAQRPSATRRTEERAAVVAQAIGMAPPQPADRRAVSDGVRLDQQVEAARAAGLTGASAPAVVGRYEVLLRIARGGMGTVYLARITGEGGFRRLFALKVIRDHLSQNDEYVRMLLQEARIASRLHHPNVVGIVDIGTLANQHYLVMDYVEGCTFSELLKVHRRTRPPHLIIPILIEALTGLHAAHALVDDDGSPLTLVHCDFSPQNMLVGTNGICRITDFGIAKAANALSERSSITRGKPAYVSPEQVLGRRVDHRSDIFSAGVVLWNALTGEQLFGGDSPEQTLQAVLQRPIVPPSTMGLRPPSCFDRVCLRALERDPDRRYQSAEQMLIDLRRIAIAEDFLAPSSDVARWVTDTFGRQLELRRQAAGISNRALGESQPIALPLAVPELGLGGDPEHTETKGLPHDYAQTPSDDHTSKTTLIRSDVVDTPRRRSNSKAAANARVFAIGAAVMFATIAIAIAIAKPEWIQGGTQDPDGHYAPNASSSSPRVAADDQGSGGQTPEPDEAEGKAGRDDEAKGVGETEPGETKPGEAKPGEPEAKAVDSDGAKAATDAKLDPEVGRVPPPGEPIPVETPIKKPRPEKPKSEKPRPPKPKQPDPEPVPAGGTTPPIKKPPPPPPPPAPDPKPAPKPDPDADPSDSIDIPGN